MTLCIALGPLWCSGLARIAWQPLLGPLFLQGVFFCKMACFGCLAHHGCPSARMPVPHAMLGMQQPWALPLDLSGAMGWPESPDSPCGGPFFTKGCWHFFCPGAPLATRRPLMHAVVCLTGHAVGQNGALGLFEGACTAGRPANGALLSSCNLVGTFYKI